jgi:hypothetical protein
MHGLLDENLKFEDSAAYQALRQDGMDPCGSRH